MDTVEVKFPDGFTDYAALMDYLRITESLARQVLKELSDGRWLRLKEGIATKMLLDQRFSGTATRPSGDVVNASWWMDQ